MRFTLLFFLFLSSQAKSASIIDRSYEYVMNMGKNLAPSLLSIMECLSGEDVWGCVREKSGKILDGWDEEVQKQRKLWREAADAEVTSTGRSIEELPSKIGQEIEDSLGSVAVMINNGLARALGRKKHDSGGIDSITISTNTGDKKMKKKKQKPAKIHLVHPVMMVKNQEKGRAFGRVQSWVVGEKVEDKTEKIVVESSTIGLRKGRGILEDLWSAGQDVLDDAAQHALDSDKSDNGVEDKSSLEEQRGKKKKKKKAILKLLILGAVLKAKIGTILQILSFKLQVKFFIIALLGLGINLARLWIDIKNKHQHQPQKVIYYEHASHQHHYDHEEEPHGWGPWSRSMEPEIDSDIEIDVDSTNTPYRAQERPATIYRPLLTRD
ncbi:uncharacterized protein LOC128681637 [Plodia interpunctella]|uniref:uncharacterized protein LOC128681637 n=1 Tax=Plodia interpunctella TaxID=58824 RepID=UPI002367EA67|nr:uncharacterized protein LOC128681637 [Plodia interpunctella]